MESDNFEEDIDGSIVSVHVRNFFCHDNLEVNLNRNVNFIVGRNGSGKSAILTALVVGLGGRASATNRGNNLHSFIKKGANSASIEIKIKNSSPKAYRHNVYGDYITIVRNINASGGSSYKVKSASGEVISTKFEEVNAIILAHDIQVDNPISVLNQDDARSFHASDAKKKYSLFRKATNLDQTENNYVRALENCNKATIIWNKKKEACADLEKEYKKWKTSHDHMKSRDETEALKQSLQNEYYWSEIADLEKEAAMIQAQYDKQKGKMDKLAEKLSQMEQNYGSNTSVIDGLKQQLDEKSLQKTALEQELRDVEGEVNDVQTKLRNTQHNKGKYTESLNREKRKVVDLEKEIHNIGSGESEARRAELEARAGRAAQAAATARARYDTAQHDTLQARANLAHALTAAEHAAGAAHRQRDTLKQLKQQLRELESRGSDSLAVYGSHMVELCRRIKDAVAKGQFSQPPRGPIGSYLKVKEKKWGGALEHIIGGSIKSFCVNSPEDSRKLFQIMGQVYGSEAKPAVTCSKFLSRVHDVRRSRVSARPHVSALDSLDVSDPVVANYLIDNVGMERVLLVPEHDDAIRLSDNEENVPQNCAKIVTLDSTEYHPAPNYRSYGGVARPSRYLHLSTAERKKQVLAEIQEAESTLRTLEDKAEKLSEEAKQARSTERAASKSLQALMGERHNKDEAARAASAALDQQQAPQHAVLVDELNISKESLSKLQRQLEELSGKESEYRQKIDQFDVRMKQLKTQLGQLTAECRSLSEEIDQEQLKLEQGVSARRTCQQRLREDNIKMSQVRLILDNKRTAIQQKVDAALTLCPRVENPRDMATVTAELKKTQLKLSSIRSDGLTKAQVVERLLQVETKYRRTRKTLERLKKLIDDTKVTTDKHLKFCYTVQTSIARRVQHSFQAILKLRGYSGRMDIDNGRGALEIVCSGRESSARRHAASTSSLSGGERSYSTVAFIMALWDCVELPFCFMDEFDVFMDNVNRKIVMDLLIDHALKNTSRQFVFLTPQDASSVTAGPKISIYLMADPRP
ncbi:structural maintenance of chromosomes 6 [Anticarsia gemmatalis]|uniref:structural maintenance of chromosomes 6 n=1 Tax=Anticarsia gemmatalis TaxID=129554 RepID=UPI003F75DCDD